MAARKYNRGRPFRPATIMRRLSWFLLGILTVIVVVAIAGLVFTLNAHGFSANAQPSKLEVWLAETARAMALPRDAANRRNPIANSPEVIAEGRAHWADHCALCHANNGSGETEIGSHLYPPAPDMRKSDTQQMSDGELFYIIENGVRMTGMPAWGGPGHSQEDSWKLVHFIRHLPQLSAAEELEMEKLNPKGPQERNEEKEEEEFLNGENNHEQTQTAHHHH